MTEYVETNLTTAFNTYQNTAATGDRVLLADGVYNNATRKSLTKNASGVVEFGAQNVGGATITGEAIDLTSNNIKFRGFDLAFTTSAAQYIDINGTGCQFTRNNCHFANPGANRKWVRVRANDATIDHNKFYSKTNDDVLLLVFKTGETTTGCKILYNYFFDVQGLGNDTEVIRVGDSGRCTYQFGTEIAYNRFEDIGADPELISCKGSGLNIHHNTCVNCDAAITLRQCTDCTVDSNTLVNTGLRAYGKNHIITRNQFIENARNDLRQALVVGNADVEEYPVDTSNANYARFKNCRIENNIFANKNATANSIFIFGYKGSCSGCNTLPTGNTIRSNIMTATTGQLTDEINSASFASQTASNNIIYPTGSATVGDMPASAYRNVNPNLTQLADGSYRCAIYLDNTEVGPGSI